MSIPDPACALGLIDLVLLTWAAGFFDGEGSTIVHESHPGYLRLTVCVPQLGGEEPPEVLFRFKAAMLGLGEIRPQNDEGMWVWRSRSGEEGQAAVALLWSQIGRVKREQAASALGRFHAQYGPSGIRSRAARRTRLAHADHATGSTPILAPGTLDLAWSAGFLDGEGHFGLPRAAERKNGPPWHRVRVSATQKGLPARPPEVLFKLQLILGGNIERHGEPDDFRWLTEGIHRVEDVFLRVRPCLGTVKQEQALVAIEGFRGQARLHGNSERCIRGHPYDRVYLSSTGPKRRCSACARILSRLYRAARGISPRPFSDTARRYNF